MAAVGSGHKTMQTTKAASPRQGATMAGERPRAASPRQVAPEWPAIHEGQGVLGRSHIMGERLRWMGTPCRVKLDIYLVSCGREKGKGERTERGREREREREREKSVSMAAATSLG